MTTIKTLFGTFDDHQLKALKGCVDEIVESMHKIEQHNDAIKSVIDATHDAMKVPKKILRRMAKVRYKNSYPEEVSEQKEFEALFEGMQDVK